MANNCPSLDLGEGEVGNIDYSSLQNSIREHNQHGAIMKTTLTNRYTVTRKTAAIATRFFLLLMLAIAAASALLFAETNFTVPADLALRIRLDDTLTSTDSRVGDPFSATVVEKGEYRDARVYGRVVEIDKSGRIKGHTSMMLQFDRLVMPDGRRAAMHAEIVELYHAPSGEKVDVEGAIESGGRGRKTITHTVIGAGAGALLGGIFGGGKGAGIGSVIGGAGGLGTTAFAGRQKITLNSGLEMLIRVTGR
jgi:hypothetical protein